MANYMYKESKVTTKKLAGIYDAGKHTICVDGVDMDLLSELDDFDNVPIDLVVKIKEEKNLSEE